MFLEVPYYDKNYPFVCGIVGQLRRSWEKDQGSHIKSVALKEMGQYFNILTSATYRVMHTDKNIIWTLNTRRKIRLVNTNYIGKGQLLCCLS